LDALVAIERYKSTATLSLHCYRLPIVVIGAVVVDWKKFAASIATVDRCCHVVGFAT